MEYLNGMENGRMNKMLLLLLFLILICVYEIENKNKYHR